MPPGRFPARWITAAAMVALPYAAPLMAQRPASDQFDAYVARAVRDWHVPGLAIAVVKDDSVVFAKGYGVRELGKAGAVDAGTRFAIGSTTKAMTVVALGMLVDEGKVRWDDPVIKYLPTLQLSDPYVTRELTVRDLLTHRSGLGNADLLWAGADHSMADITRRIRNLAPAYSFRSGFIYQNIMYSLAGDVVAAASGMPWDAFLRARIFTPLGMTSTEAKLSDVAGKPNVATPHMEIGDTMRVIANRPVDPVAPAGSVWSSVGDMSKWMRFVLDSGRVGGKRLLSAAAYKEIFTPQVVAPPDMYPTTALTRPHFFTYGLGWFLHDYQGQAVTMHTGSIDGMSAIIGLVPDKRMGVYVLANSDHAELRHALMFQAFDMYAGTASKPARDWSADLLELYGGLHAQAVAAERKQDGSRVTGTHPTLPLERYAGTYSEPTFGDVVVSVRDGVLALELGSTRAGKLEHWQYDTFRAHWDDVRSKPSNVVFAPDGAGGVATLRAFGVTFTRPRQAR
jgi:CubicO group peptidase (beta-lactamase class C family)